MKFKSKYNIGDIVLFYTNSWEQKIGRIISVCIKFSYETLKKISYDISLFVPNSSQVYTNYINENDIIKKINKKAFEKIYAEECAKYVVNENLEGD